MSAAWKRLEFRPRPWPTLAAAALLPLLLWLGSWQLDRAEQKRALIEAYRAGVGAPARPYAAELPRFARVVAHGRWEGERQFLLDAAVLDGRVGFRVLTPLRLEGGSALLVDRGWVAGDPSRRSLPDVALAAPAAEVAVVGLLDELPRAGIGAGTGAATGLGGAAPWPRVVLYPSLAEVEGALGMAVEQRLLRLDPGAPEGYARAFDPDLGMPRERHLAYATTWFTLAAILLGLWLFLNLRRRETS